VTGEDAAVEAVGLLADPVRRALYRYVAGSPGEVGRDEAAKAVDVSRSLAAFHLDKLVEAGLLATGYRRLSGRSGPGAGRPAKLYRRADTEHSVSLPPRSYAGLAGLLAGVIEDAGLDHELQAAARAEGASSTVDNVPAALAERGYQPYRDGASLRLGNCPFHALATAYPPLVCGMNLALLEGLLAGAPDGDAWLARMDPRPGTCCVALKQKMASDTIRG
jgi:predicted ArsR family transcriptional regulator